MAVDNTAQGIIERGMKRHAEIDTNIRALILEQLSDFLDELYSIYDLNQAVKFSNITISSETLAMPADFLRFVNVVYDAPWYGFHPEEIEATRYNELQSQLSTTITTPPQYVYPDHLNRVLRFIPVTSGSLTGKLMYFPQFADITLSSDLSFFPMTTLLVLFCYIAYTEYDGFDPKPQALESFQRLKMQLPMKYQAKKESPGLSNRYFRAISVSE